MPWRAWRSEPQIPQRSTSRRTWPFAGVGSGSSATLSSAFWQTTAFMAVTLSRGRDRDVCRIDLGGAGSVRHGVLLDKVVRAERDLDLQPPVAAGDDVDGVAWRLVARQR